MPAPLKALFSFALFSISICYSAAQNLPVPQAITDPAKLTSTSLPDFKPLTLEKFFTTRQFEGMTWSPDGKEIAFTSNISGRMNIWTIPSEGGWPKQLTISEQRQNAPSWSPDGKWIAYVSDTDGDELWDIWLVNPKTGETTNLTLSPKVEEGRAYWSPDSKRIVYQTRPKDKAAYEIDVMEIATHKTTHITQNTADDQLNSGPTLSARWQVSGVHSRLRG